jgi:hypothetical protein
MRVRLFIGVILLGVLGISSPALRAASCSNDSLGSGIVCVQSASNAAGSTDSVSQAFPNPNASGHLIILALGLSNHFPGAVPATDFTCADTAGNHYAHRLINSNNGTTGDSQIILFYAENSAAGGNTVTCGTMSGSYDLMLAIGEYSGLAISGAYDVSNSGESSGNGPVSVSSGNVISTQAIELQFAFVYDQTNMSTVFSGPSGFTQREYFTTVNNHTMATYDNVVTSAATYSASVTITPGSSALFLSLSGFTTTNRQENDCTNTPVGLGVTCVQAVDSWLYGGATAVNSLTVTYTNAAKHFLLYTCGAEGTTSTETITFTDSNGNTIVPIGSASQSNEVIAWAYVSQSNSGSNTVTCTQPGITEFAHMNLIAAEYKGLAPINPLDVETSMTASGVTKNSQSTGSITTGAGKRLILAVCYNRDNPSSYYPTAGALLPEYTSVNLNPYAPQGMSFADGTVTTSGTYAATLTGSAGRLDALIASFKTASFAHSRAQVY